MKNKGQYVVAPSLSDVMEDHADDVGSKLRVCMVGIVQTYDPAKRTATVALAENFVLNDGTVIVPQYPLLDVPVYTLQGGGIHFGAPVQPKDECLLVFCDFNIDAWFAAGGQQTPPDSRQHDISDAFALVGLNSLGNPLASALLATEGGVASALAKVAIDRVTQLITISKGVNSLGPILTTFLSAVAIDPLVSPGTRTAAANAVTALAGLLS